LLCSRSFIRKLCNRLTTKFRRAPTYPESSPSFALSVEKNTTYLSYPHIHIYIQHDNYTAIIPQLHDNIVPVLWYIKYGTKPYLQHSDDCASRCSSRPARRRTTTVPLYIMLCIDRNAFQIRVASRHSVVAVAPALGGTSHTYVLWRGRASLSYTTLARCTI